MTKSVPHLNNRTGYVLLTLFFLTPGLCQASVFFNEVAWMGDASSANHEWIELYNDGAATTVDGWVLSDGRNLFVELTGTIPANTYAVLERTSEESAPGAAFFVYTGALHNSGGTLRLENAAGELVDVVAGGENWEQIGGDNTTKETAQYTPKGWITAAATPGAQNKSAPTVSADTSNETEEADESAEKQSESQTKSTKSSNVQTVRLVLPDMTLAVEIDAQSVGYVHQTIPFHSTASGVGQTLLDSLQYQWNFGDGNTAQFADGNHAFAFPGTYVVTLHAEFKRQTQVARHEITILPVALSLTQNTHGDIQLNNDSPYEVDISGYTVQAKEAFVFPKYSIILPNQTITLPRQTIAETHPTMIAVYDTHKTLLASLLPVVTPRQKLAEANPTTLLLATQSNSNQANNPAPISAPASAPPSPPTPALAVQPTQSQKTARPEPTRIPTDEYQSPNTREPIIETETPSDTPTRTQRLSYVALAVVILLSIFSIYLTPRRNQPD